MSLTVNRSLSSGRRGLFLDFDGTLADTLGGLRQVYREFVRDHGGEPSDEEFNRLNGPPLREVVAALQAAHGIPGDPGRLLIAYVERAQQVSRRHAPAERAEQVLQRARQADFRIMVVTSAQRSFVAPWLRQYRLDGYFDGIIGAEDVSRGKPDPQPYLRALERCGCDAAVSVAAEDTGHGALAALRAGLTTYLVGPRRPPAEVADHPRFGGHLPTFSGLEGVL